MPSEKLQQAVAAYFADLRRVQASGGATGERSAYGALTDLLNVVGDTLRPKVFCVPEMADQGAGHPDFGLYTTHQTQRARGQRRGRGQVPERGVVEVKGVGDDAWLTADGEQVSRYWERYRQVLVTNTRDFVMVGEDANGQPVRLETFRLTDSAADFAERLEHPRAFANEVGFCHLWGQAKHAELAATAETAPDSLYDEVAPLLHLNRSQGETRIKGR